MVAGSSAEMVIRKGDKAAMRGVMIGAGNVAWTLAQALGGSVDFVQVYAPTLEHASSLASIIGAEAINDVSQMADDADFYLISVADHALASLVDVLPRVPDALWAHTSGGVDASVLSPLSDNYGVFYPLQTFSRGALVDLADVPFFIEGSTETAREQLLRLARDVSNNVREADSRLRGILHIAGVLTCNFVNHLWDTASDLLVQNGMDLSVVRPLIEETLEKAMRLGPHKAQTGPARRGDTDVIARHMSMIPPEDALLYEMLSQRIMKAYSNEQG